MGSSNTGEGIPLTAIGKPFQARLAWRHGVSGEDSEDAIRVNIEESGSARSRNEDGHLRKPKNATFKPKKLRPGGKISINYVRELSYGMATELGWTDEFCTWTGYMSNAK